MAKVKSTFYCQNCGSQYSKWQGKCSSCGEWNTIVEEVTDGGVGGGPKTVKAAGRPVERRVPVAWRDRADAIELRLKAYRDAGLQAPALATATPRAPSSAARR